MVNRMSVKCQSFVGFYVLDLIFVVTHAAYVTRCFRVRNLKEIIG